MDLSALRYAATHEWARAEGDLVTVGITAFAVEQLKDIVYLELPEPGRSVEAGQPMADVESVKAVSEIYAPVSGRVVARNDAAVRDPGLVAADPYGDGWLVQIRASDLRGLDRLMTSTEYEAHCAAQEC